MTPREQSDRPLVRGGQGRHGAEVLFGARVVMACAAGALAVWVARVMGAL